MTSNTISPLSQSSATALLRLEKVILDTLDFNNVVQHTVDSLLTELEYMQLGYRIIVLVLLDKTNGVLKRIAISQTEEGKKAVANSPVPFKNIDIPISAKDNLLVKVLETKQPSSTTNWTDILTPAFTNDEAINIQQSIGIKTSLVYPVVSKNEVIGVMIFSLVKTQDLVSDEEKDLITGFTDIVGLALQNSILYTSLERTTEDLKVANEKLKSLDKLKDEFVSLASHELRTPMTAIKSYLWLVLYQKEVGELNDKQKTYLERTYQSTERLIKLVNDMLNVSRIESGRLTISVKPLDIVKLAQDSIADIMPNANARGLTLTVVPPVTPLEPVMADPEKIKEIFINLVGNSLKFTPSGGKIEITFEKKDNQIQTNIIDNGKGIKPEDMKTLFHKFGMIEGNYATKAPGQGSGLGLYITKSIIEMHGGKVEIFSEGEDKGTKFSFTLNIAKATDQAKEIQVEAKSEDIKTPIAQNTNPAEAQQQEKL